ncbi:hypothetical protein MVEG_12273 [Podila verticillata NRRL 6337]|uniref:F-box domain-containing protein n=1 Tax=Podila verticillata NRRL 6337 TaxID=1069443 RepID=A0A086TJ12_9FUNG|nr:MAG: hypothetical protein BYD32DRAFT_423075 [Podila humilis]KFH61939.1 hypothetical protein MVEG_12273 [Podila verticillata NRRL 6337]
MNTSVLDNPDLLPIVARYIPLWVAPNFRTMLSGPVFSPKPLINCIKVCRLWQQIMTPILWEMYNYEAMLRCNIPPEVIEAQSHHFRFVHIAGPDPIPQLLKARRVRRLVLSKSENLETFLDLIINNGDSLTTLEWHLPDSGDTALKKEAIQYALEKLTKLESLSLTHWSHCSVGQIARIAKNNPGLKKLSFTFSKNLAQTPGTHPPLNVTELNLDGQWEDNPGFVQLLQLCPKLESIKFWATSTIPAAAVSKNLREYCPKLTSIRSLNSIMPTTIGGSPDEDDVVEIVRAATGLVHFEFPMDDLTSDITKALLDLHAETLETMRLYLDGGDPLSLTNINVILTECSNLAILAVENEQDEWSPEDAENLLADPWNCPKLKFLQVTGFNVIGEDYEELDDYAFDVEEDEYSSDEDKEAYYDTFPGMSKEARAARKAMLKADKATLEVSFQGFTADLEKRGWTLRSSHPTEEYKCLKPAIEHIMDRVFTMSEMEEVLLGHDLFFVRKNVKPF